jgi:small basic protein (TIGR04137 family)
MTIDSSLRIRRGGVKVRNVLRRHERLAKLQEDGRWKEEESTVLGMPKVRVFKLSLKKKKKVKTEGEGEGKGGKGKK